MKLAQGRAKPLAFRVGVIGVGAVRAVVTPTPCVKGLACPQACCAVSDGRAKPMTLGPPPSRGRGRRDASFDDGIEHELRRILLECFGDGGVDMDKIEPAIFFRLGKVLSAAAITNKMPVV